MHGFPPQVIFFCISVDAKVGGLGSAIYFFNPPQLPLACPAGTGFCLTAVFLQELYQAKSQTADRNKLKLILIYQ
jgi:hypothetical protein